MGRWFLSKHFQENREQALCLSAEVLQAEETLSRKALSCPGTFKEFQGGWWLE